MYPNTVEPTLIPSLKIADIPKTLEDLALALECVGAAALWNNSNKNDWVGNKIAIGIHANTANTGYHFLYKDDPAIPQGITDITYKNLVYKYINNTP